MAVSQCGHTPASSLRQYVSKMAATSRCRSWSAARCSGVTLFGVSISVRRMGADTHRAQVVGVHGARADGRGGIVGVGDAAEFVLRLRLGFAFLDVPLHDVIVFQRVLAGVIFAGEGLAQFSPLGGVTDADIACPDLECIPMGC